VEELAVTTSPLEAALARLWSRLLRVSHVDRDDDFLLLGGNRADLDSLIASVNSLFRVDLKIESLPQDAVTVAGMARAIIAARSGAAADEQIPTCPTVIPRRQEGEALQLSAAQRRMWFLARLYPDDPTYNQSRAYRLVGEIDVDALDRSVRYIARRHEILRATYSLVDDEPEPIISEDVAVEIKRVDLSEVPSSQHNEAVQALLLSEMQKPFDLESAPPWRILVLRLSSQEHVLLRVTHHIVYDGWTSGIFERELSTVYSALVQGLEPRLPVLPVQYADYAAWQRESLQGKTFADELNYWRTQLTGLSKLDLPTDRPRPPVPSYRGTNLTYDLPVPLTDKLKELGRHEGTTLFMKLVAIFQVLLYRYSDQEDIAVGVPIAGRKRTGLEGLLGLFANTLVLRTDLSGNPSFRELLARVRKTALDAYTHQDVPFEKLVEELGPERDMSRNPLFQVMFVLQNVPDAALEMEGLKVNSVALESHSAKFDLTLSVRESAQGFQTNWEYASDLFDGVTVKRMAQHFERLLEAVVADPDQSIGALALLTESERTQLLVEWNDTAADYPKDRSIHELFEAQAAQTPDKTALVCDEQQLTYVELNQRANELAHYLKEAGVGPGDLVGVCLGRGLDSIVALLGILKAGAAYVPLDPGYPKERIAFMMQDSGAKTVLTDENSLGSLPATSARANCLDRDWQDIAQRPLFNPNNQSTAEDLAYVIYTSGSTGQPKGVQVSHRAVINCLRAVSRECDFSARDTWLAVTTLCFDIAALEIFLPLTIGATLFLANRDEILDAAALTKRLASSAATVMQATPTTWNLVLENGWAGPPGFKILCGGEPLSRRLARELLTAGSLWNCYGPTEATIWSALHKVEPGERPVYIGRPIANTEVYILDGHLNPVPIGVAGELYIGGDGLARGYLNRPALTKERFIGHPFSAQARARLFKTGDQARYSADGNIEFLGRLDNQVKIRGYRIELREIEAVLGQHPRVRETVVLTREVSPGDKRLVAYVVTGGNQVEINALRDFLKQKLPDYMVPSAFVFLDTLPLTANGKIDRRALPAPQYDHQQASDNFVTPRDVLEESIAKIWREVLRLECIGVHDNFFELGGHSLTAMQISARLRRTLRSEIALRDMFDFPTIAQFAEAARKLKTGCQLKLSPNLLEKT
jgi:amino acid adenylation domain-containing protein